MNLLRLKAALEILDCRFEIKKKKKGAERGRIKCGVIDRTLRGERDREIK